MNISPSGTLIQQKVSLISGQSGVGKSTLVNSIYPELDLRTGALAKHSGKGAHTTTFAEMFKTPDGGYLIDTPGIKEFGIVDIEPTEVSHYFPEMRSLIEGCNFNNCLHINEPGCAVKEALVNDQIDGNRYMCYLGVVEELQEEKGY